jgi:pyruvyltransferase
MPVEIFAWTPPPRPVVDVPGLRRFRRPAVNFGDELGPVVVRAMLARLGLPNDDSVADGRLLAVGSVLHFARPGDVVWGAGVNGKTWPELHVTPGDLDVRAVRGPETRRLLESVGFDVPEVYGDPALLLPALDPRFALAGTTPRRRLAVVPNLNDLAAFRRHPDLVSPLRAPLEVAREIAASELVVGSSLHAMALADALGVASRPVRSAHEHPLKYRDYYAGTGRDAPVPAETVDDAVRAGPVEALPGPPDALAAAFPVELFARSPKSRDGAAAGPGGALC